MTVPRAYLDCNASEPLRAEARQAVLASLEVAGNPSAVHQEGRRARSLVETAREQVAQLVGAKSSEVYFTSGATEANNWVMRAGWSVILLSAIEHDSVQLPAETARSGSQTILVGADRSGRASVEDMAAQVLRLAPSAGSRPLASLHMANNETGVVQPVAEWASFMSAHAVATHTDATQAAGRLPIDFAALGVDFLSLSSHKLGGPRGVGALIVRKGCELPPLIAGGGQERRLRAGTENVDGIVGFGAAAAAAARDLTDAAARIAALRDRLEHEVVRRTPSAIVVGADAPRLPGTSMLAVPGLDAETMVIKFDLAGVAISAGAACSSGKVGASRVLTAMGFGPSLAGISSAAIRISMGHATTAREIELFLAAWDRIVAEPARKLATTAPPLASARPSFEEV